MRIGEVGRCGPRHGHAMEPLRIGELERGPAGHHDPNARGARERDVRPPVDRHGMCIRVGHLDIDHKVPRPGPQPEVQLVHKVPHPLPLVDAKAWSAIEEPEGSCVHRRTCQCCMPCGSQIPLDSAREPGISTRDCRTVSGRCCQQLPTANCPEATRAPPKSRTVARR